MLRVPPLQHCVVPGLLTLQGDYQSACLRSRTCFKKLRLSWWLLNATAAKTTSADVCPVNARFTDHCQPQNHTVECTQTGSNDWLNCFRPITSMTWTYIFVVVALWQICVSFCMINMDACSVYSGQETSHCDNMSPSQQKSRPFSQHCASSIVMTPAALCFAKPKSSVCTFVCPVLAVLLFLSLCFGAV